MVRIAPVRLTYNPKTLWFDAGDFQLEPGQAVIVQTARGLDFGKVDKKAFEATDEQVKSLKTALKPVKRLATEDDVARMEELDRKNREALPVFKRLAAETVPDMRPVAVEFLFDSDKAVFYFEAEERVDFRELVRKLASEFHLRIDMKQIGVRDEARMIGGIGHCGQELCCRRLGGNFNPVSIRMAKEQDLSLNPQKISGLCGRLMCCLRYEYDTYKEFHSRAPKKNARVQTPDGVAKVVDLDVPREMVSLQVEGEKAVKIPLAGMEPPEEGAKRPNAVGQKTWDAAHEESGRAVLAQDSLFETQLSAGDKLADRTRVRRFGGEAGRPGRESASQRQPSQGGHSRRRRNGSRGQADSHARNDRAREQHPSEYKARRRRSTKVEADGSTVVSKAPEARSGQKGDGRAHAAHDQGGQRQGQPQSSNRRPRRRHAQQGAGSGAKPQGARQSQTQGKTRENGPGRNSSNLRTSHKAENASEHAGGQRAGQGQASGQGGARRRRRTHKASGQGGADAGKANTSQGE